MMTSAQLDARLWCLTGRECAACELQHGPMCEPGTFEERIEALLTDRAELEAENERLRHDAEQWRKHERGVTRVCEQGMADLARLAALEVE